MSIYPRKELFICPAVNLPDENGLGGHSHLFECPNCPDKFVPAELLADCPGHAVDVIATMVDGQLSNRPAPECAGYATTSCYLCGTTWDAEFSQCPSGCGWETTP